MLKRMLLALLLAPQISAMESQDTIIAQPNQLSQDEYCQSMLDAIVQGNLTSVQNLLLAGANVNAQIIHGITALMWTGLHGRTAICKLLLKHGAKVNTQDDRGWTALMWAAHHGRWSICKALIHHESQFNRAEQLLNIRNNEGKRACDLAYFQYKCLKPNTVTDEFGELKEYNVEAKKKCAIQ